MFIAIGVTLLFIVACAVIDSEHLNKNQYIKSHTSRSILRACFFIAMGLCSWVWIFASALMFTALFDQTLNKFRGLPFWYLGTVAKWDIFFKKRMWLYVIVKLLAMFGSIILFIYG